MPLSSLNLAGSKASLKERTFQLAKAVDINTRKLRQPDALWHGQKRKKKVGCRAYIDAVVDSVMLEVVVGVIIAADLILTILTFTLSEAVAESTEVFVVGAIFLIVLLGDVMLRVAKYRLPFFHRPLNWLEFIVALAGCVMLVFEGVERAGCGGPCDKNRSATGGGTSLGRSIRPTIKAWRIVRTAMQLTNSRGGLHKQLDRQTDRFFGRLIRLYLNDFFLIPTQNVYLKPSAGSLHVEKAQVRSTVLKGLHLPLTISCGIIDLLHVKVSLSDSKEDSELGEESNHKMLVVIENALIVVGPGHHQEKPAPPWDFDSVLAAKKKLIDILTRRLEAGAKQRVAHASTQGGKGKKGGGLVGKALKSWVKSHMEEVLARGVHISFQNVEVRYEDPLGVLSQQGRTAVVGGMRIGYITVRAAGATEEDELDQEVDFRAKGRWRFQGDSLRADTMGATSTNVSATNTWSDKFNSEKYTSETTVHLDDGPTKGSGFSRRSVAKSKRKLSQGVRAALTADRICAFWDLADPTEGHVAKKNSRQTVAARYTDMLAEGSGVDIESFLEDHALLRRRERFRLALCKEVELRMTHTCGSCVAREFARRLRDRVAAHKYIVMPFGGTIHAVIRPPPQEVAATTGRGSHSCLGTSSSIGSVPIASRQPHADVSVEVSMVSMSPDIKQVKTMAWLADYVKRWQQEEKRFQWHPPPAGVGHRVTSLAYARWNYALHRILTSIDQNHSWHSLGWIGLQRRCNFRSAYYHELTAFPPLDQDSIAVLQVALPLPDALYVRKEAALAVAYRARMRQRRVQAREFLRSLTVQLGKKNGTASESALPRNGTSGDIEQGEVTTSSAAVTSTTASSTVNPEKQEKKSKFAFKPGDLALQVHVWIGTAKLGALSPEPTPYAPRKPILLGQATDIDVTALIGAPRKVWMRFAPPEAAASMATEAAVPEGVVAEISVRSARAVWYGAPSSAWQLRRAFFCGGGGLGPRGGRPEDDKKTYAPGESSKGEKAQAFFGAKGQNLTKALAEARILVRVADMGDVEPDKARGLWHAVPKRNWVFAACVPALEVHVLKPFIQALVRTVKPPKQPPSAVVAAQQVAAMSCAKARRTSLASRRPSVGTVGTVNSWLFGGAPSVASRASDKTEGSFTVGGSASSSSALRTAASHGQADTDFWAFLIELQRKRTHKSSAEGKKRKNEKVMGATGFAKGAVVQGSILFFGGLRADVLESDTNEKWVIQGVHLPAGTMRIYRGGIPPQVKAGFRPMEDAPGTKGGLTQVSNGWWFETEAQAKAAREVQRDERLVKKLFTDDEDEMTFEGMPGKQDRTCAGTDAVEDPEEGYLSHQSGSPKSQNSMRDISSWQHSLVRTLRYKPRESDKGLLQTGFLHSPRSPRTPRKNIMKPSTSANTPLCCADLSMACATSIAAKRRFRSASPILGARSRLARLPSWCQAMPAAPFSLASTRKFGPPQMESMDIDVWVEVLTPEEVGLPAPKHAEDLWASMGCSRIPDSRPVSY